MELHASLCNYMQAHETECMLIELHAMSWNCISALGTACRLIEMPAISWICMQPWVTLGNPRNAHRRNSIALHCCFMALIY